MKLLTQDEANKATDIFVGVWRMPFSEIRKHVKAQTLINIPGGEEFCAQYFANNSHFDELLRVAYTRGDFDEPLYRRIIEPS